MSNNMKMWDLVLSVSVHIYIRMRKEFLIKEERYSEWVMFVVEDGCFQYKIQNVTDTASKGDIVICPPGVDFKRKVLSALSFHFIRFSWINHSKINNDVIPIGKIKVIGQQRLSSTCLLLQKLSNIYSPAAMEWKNHLIRDIWYLYASELTIQQIEPYITADDPIVNSAISYMHEKANENFCIRSLADLLGLSSAQFTRKFKSVLGVSPIQYLTSIRIKNIQRLLTDTSMTLAQIAAYCGYENEYYLSRIFSKKTGTNPSLYRKLYRV